MGKTMMALLTPMTISGQQQKVKQVELWSRNLEFLLMALNDIWIIISMKHRRMVRFKAVMVKKAKGSKTRGVHFKKKRYGRKMIKALEKIAKRRPITRKEQRQRDQE